MVDKKLKKEAERKQKGKMVAKINKFVNVNKDLLVL